MEKIISVETDVKLNNKTFGSFLSDSHFRSHFPELSEEEAALAVYKKYFANDYDAVKMNKPVSSVNSDEKQQVMSMPRLFSLNSLAQLIDAIGTRSVLQ